MDERQTILVVDDDDSIRSALSILLGRAGLRTLIAGDAATALAFLNKGPVDLVLLDVVLDESNPHVMSGLDVLRSIRRLERFIPVIMLTSYNEWQVESLGLGAIAFVTKPWEVNALISQIRTTLNAVSRIQQDAVKIHESAGQVLTVHDVRINTTQLRVFRAEREVDLTPLEFALLLFLARNPDREWTREELLDKVWGFEWVGYPRTVDRHVAALRRKLHLGRDELIETVHNIGYRLAR